MVVDLMDGGIILPARAVGILKHLHENPSHRVDIDIEPLWIQYTAKNAVQGVLEKNSDEQSTQ